MRSRVGGRIRLREGPAIIEQESNDSVRVRPPQPNYDSNDSVDCRWGEAAYEFIHVHCGADFHVYTYSARRHHGTWLVLPVCSCVTVLLQHDWTRKQQAGLAMSRAKLGRDKKACLPLIWGQRVVETFRCLLGERPATGRPVCLATDNLRSVLNTVTSTGVQETQVSADMITMCVEVCLHPPTTVANLDRAPIPVTDVWPVPFDPNRFAADKERVCGAILSSTEGIQRFRQVAMVGGDITKIKADNVLPALFESFRTVEQVPYMVSDVCVCVCVCVCVYVCDPPSLRMSSVGDEMFHAALQKLHARVLKDGGWVNRKTPLIATSKMVAALFHEPIEPIRKVDYDLHAFNHRSNKSDPLNPVYGPQVERFIDLLLQRFIEALQSVVTERDKTVESSVFGVYSKLRLPCAPEMAAALRKSYGNYLATLSSLSEEDGKEIIAGADAWIAAAGRGEVVSDEALGLTQAPPLVMLADQSSQ